MLGIFKFNRPAARAHTWVGYGNVAVPRGRLAAPRAHRGRPLRGSCDSDRHCPGHLPMITFAQLHALAVALQVHSCRLCMPRRGAGGPATGRLDAPATRNRWPLPEYNSYGVPQSQLPPEPGRGKDDFLACDWRHVETFKSSSQRSRASRDQNKSKRAGVANTFYKV